MTGRGIILLLLFSLVLFGISIYSLFYLDTGAKPGPTSSISSNAGNGIGGNFELINTKGKKVTNEDLKGHYSLVYFGYSCCPDVCPATLGKISDALKSLSPDELKKIRGYFITLDPKRDNIKQLKDFMKGFSPAIQGLTGSTESIKEASDAYKIYSQKNHESDEENYLIDHTSLVYLMDPDGHCLSFFSYGATTEEMKAEIKKQLDQ